MSTLKKGNKNKILGLTLGETLVVVAIGLLISLSVYFFINNFREKLQNQEIASNLIQITTAMDTRYSIDGYSANNFNRTSWTSTADVNNFLNSFNGKNSSCSSTDGWVPNTSDTALKDKYIKEKFIPCNIYKEQPPLDSKMEAKLVVNAVNNQILVSYVAFYYDNDTKMQANFSRWRNIISESYNRDTLNNASKHLYAFMDRSTNEFITDSECLEAKKDCALAVGVVSDEASSLIHLSTIGENKQVGKISFSKGILNPQVCQKWAYNGSSWDMTKTVCGIENNNEQIGFKLGDINSNFVMLDKTCSLRETDADKYVNVTDVSGVKIPVNVGNIPCGISSSISGSQFVVTSIVDDLKTNKLFVKELSTQNFNADSLSVANLTATEKLKVYGSTTITDNLQVRSALDGTSVLTKTLTAFDMKGNNPFDISSLTITENLVDKYLVTANTANANAINSTFMNATDVNSNIFVSKGDFAIGGNIITSDLKETGVLSADTINFVNPTLISASGSMGGSAELDGETLPSGVTAGIAAKSVTAENYFLQLYSPDSYDYMLDVKNGTETTFGVTTRGGVYLKNGLIMTYPGYESNRGMDRYSIDSSGNLTMRVNYFEQSGCCADAPSQFYGLVGITGNFIINSNPRFVDVEDLATNTNSFAIDSNFVLPRPGYTLADQKKNTLVMNNFRLNSYAYYISQFEAKYNTLNNAITTAGLRGDTGDKGIMGVQGDQGKKGEQGNTGAQGPTGPLYNANTAIWLPKEVTCGSADSVINTKYGSSNNLGAWTYDDVIEGVCGASNVGKVKYFKRETAIDNVCSASQKEYDVYECKEAKYRKEPYAYNYTVKGNFCLGDSTDNSDPSKGITDTSKNTICYTDLNKNHATAGRAYSGFLTFYYANGTDALLGTKNKETSLKSKIGENKWSLVSSCGGSSRKEEDLLGLEMQEYIEDNLSKITENNLGTACSTNGEIRYREITSNSTYYGNPTEFSKYKEDKFTNVSKYLKNNASTCGRTQMYEISKCEKSYTDLTKLDYTTHPKGFPMPKKDDAPVDTGLTGKYVWLKGSQVCLDGAVSDSYPGVTDWYSTDRLYTACSVEDSYRSESLGVCGTNSDKFSYQMYRCRDEYYMPATQDLSYKVTDIKCLNSDGLAVDSTTQMPLPVEKITDYYPDIKIVSSSAASAGKACTVEREEVAVETKNSTQCSQNYVNYTVYQCR
jgi:hypothetical protein